MTNKHRVNQLMGETTCYPTNRDVNPPCYQTLRIDKEGMIDNVISHDK